MRAGDFGEGESRDTDVGPRREFHGERLEAAIFPIAPVHSSIPATLNDASIVVFKRQHYVSKARSQS